jgi:hypothetical protein
MLDLQVPTVRHVYHSDMVHHVCYVLVVVIVPHMVHVIVDYQVQVNVHVNPVMQVMVVNTVMQSHVQDMVPLLTQVHVHVPLGYPNCIACSSAANCNGIGTCKSDGTCLCPTGYKNAQCQTCQTNYWNWPTCTYCTNQDTCNNRGQCQNSNTPCKCNYGSGGVKYTGPYCNECPTNYYSQVNIIFRNNVIDLHLFLLSTSIMLWYYSIVSNVPTLVASTVMVKVIVMMVSLAQVNVYVTHPIVVQHVPMLSLPPYPL